ncbi:uncharacterized protein DS421_14g473590 [Arachis hypogaea]|nr:uncharacterized protein DS421_14g473590 [Arachis hypogaea]
MSEVDRWSNIHQDLLNEVTQRFYSYDNDYLQLRLVCKQWNLKLPKIPTGNKVPWLLLPIGGGAAKKSFEEVRSLEEEDIYQIMQLPTIDEETLDTDGLEEEGIYHFMAWELQDNSICGSCHGWLIIVMVYEGPMGRIYEAAPPPSDTGCFKCYYLIGCANGSLLMLIRRVRRRCKVVETVKFYVYELKKNEKAWSRIYDLGNYILVIGLNSSVQMLSSKGNQIYFTDNMRIAHSPYLAEPHDIGIFNLEDGSFKKLLTDVKFFCPPVWILS